MRVCALFLLALGSASAQPVSIGVKAGVPLTELLAASSPGYQSSTQRFTVGPTVELGLPYRFAFEVDAIYKRMEFGFSQPASSASGSPPIATTTAGRWEFPLLLKHRLGRASPRPFWALGVSFNHVTGEPPKNLIELRHRGAKGFLIAAGLEARFGLFRLAPEVRVIRWADRNFGVRDAPLRSNLTQAEFLVGWTF